MNTTIKLIKSPDESDWVFCKNCALVTVGKHTVKPPDQAWKHAILQARHSPIRTLQFAFYLQGVPYYVSTHLARHVHAQPFIRSQRNDRQDAYDRKAARQDAPVDMIWYMSAEELMTVANKRLCMQAEKNTREIVRMMCDLVESKFPEFKGLLAPPCEVYGTCMEMFPCGKLGVK